MANTPIPGDPTLASARGFLESIQDPKLRAGGPSSSGILNAVVSRLRRDLSRLSVDTADSAYQASLLAKMLSQQALGLSRAYAGLASQVDGLPALTGSGAHKALADLSLCACVVNDPSLTSADVSPLFGQATLPARSRQNCLAIERGGLPTRIPSDAAILYALQPTVTSTVGAAPPPDYAFGEDPDSVCAMDGVDMTPWVVPDPTASPHVVWVEVRLPGGVSGAYRCNELEFVPACPFAMSLIAVKADVIGQGWQDLDFSYLGGYDGATKSVIGLGPSRLCFPQAQVRRFRLGLYVSGPWGFSRIRALSAAYQPSATLTVNYSHYSPGVLQTVGVYGKDPQALSYLSTGVTGSQVTCTLAPPGSGSETCVITGVGVTWA